VGHCDVHIHCLDDVGGHSTGGVGHFDLRHCFAYGNSRGDCIVVANAESDAVSLDHVAVHVGVGRVFDIARPGEASMSVNNIALFVALLDFLEGKARNNRSSAIVLEDFLAVGDDHGDAGLYLNFLVDGNNLINGLKHDLGHHFGHINHMHDLLINHDSDLLLVRDHHWDFDLFGHRDLSHDSLESIIDLRRSAAALGGRTSTV